MFDEGESRIFFKEGFFNVKSCNRILLTLNMLLDVPPRRIFCKWRRLFLGSWLEKNFKQKTLRRRIDAWWTGVYAWWPGAFYTPCVWSSKSSPSLKHRSQRAFGFKPSYPQICLWWLLPRSKMNCSVGMVFLQPSTEKNSQNSFHNLSFQPPGKRNQRALMIELPLSHPSRITISKSLSNLWDRVLFLASP